MNLKHLTYRFFFILLFFSFFSLYAQKNDSLLYHPKNSANDSVLIQKDTIKIKRSKGKLKDILKYDSRDQITKLNENKTYLIDDAKINYTGIELTADSIVIDWNTEIISANCKRDSMGKCLHKTTLSQGGQTVEYESMEYHSKTGIGIAQKARIEKGIPDGVMVAEKVKKMNDSILYAGGIFYTPDPEFKDGKTDDPDFYIVAKKAKLENEKVLITSAAQAYIHGAPTPLILPWGIFPLSGAKKSSSGIIIPSYGETVNRGFYLENIGFYFPFGDYLDLKTTFDIYTKGGWAGHLLSNYKKRYKFSGSFGLDYELRKNGTKGLSNYSTQTLINIHWNHAQDPKSNPNLRLSASVNYASTDYFRNTLSSQNYISGSNLTNTISSSINLTKTFNQLPVTISLSANHSENSQTKRVNLTLPQLNVNVERQYPFAPKIGSKKGLLQNLSVDYSFNFQNSVQVQEENLFKKEGLDSLRNGFKHDLTLSTGIPIARYFNFNLSGRYQEVWSLKTIEKAYNPNTNKVEETDVNGFKAFRTFNLSTNVSTNLYKTIRFDKHNKNAIIKAVRHVLTPSVSYSFTPDFSSNTFNYYKTYRDGSGKLNLYTPFEGGVYGSPGRGLSSSVGLSLRQNLEAKIRDKKSDSLGYKKIKLFDYINSSTSYNFAADSLRLSNISNSGSTKLFNDKVNINFNANFDPYGFVPTATDDDGKPTSFKRVNKFRPHLTSWNLSTGYTFNNDTFKKKSDKDKKDKKDKNPYKGTVRYDVYEFDQEGYAHFKIPWTLNLSLSHNTSRQFIESTHNTTVGIGGTIEPTPYWKLSYNTSYDFKTHQFSALRLNLTRDLRSFHMTFGWVPNGRNQTWNFFIGLKASVLQDIKYKDDNPLILNNSNGNF